MQRLLLLLFFLPCILPAQGIQFEHGSWQEAVAKAKAEGKFIFLDAYTTWCGPCKTMVAKTFPDSAVGRFFNTHFVNVKMDMERGDGVELSTRYKVWIYPTLLFLDAEGMIQHRS